MSESDAAVDGCDNAEDDDCPLCLEPLPPFWNIDRWTVSLCCGQATCNNCYYEQHAYLQRAVAEGSVGRQEEQLDGTCPFCRTPTPADIDDAGRMLVDKFEQGELPLKMHWILGTRLAIGHGVERNVERGIEILLLGAEKGDPECQYKIGGRYQAGGDGLPKSTAEAKRWLTVATEQGHAIAELALAEMAMKEGNDVEYVRYTRGSASKGYDYACYNLGIAYYQGQRGLQKSAEEAIRVAIPAAERGHVDAMRFVGKVMCKPDSQLRPPLPRDNPNFAKGAQWIRRAAEKGDQDDIIKLKQLEEWASSMCFRCDTNAPPDKSFLRCSRCRAAWYCSKDCQVQHWKAEGGHKQCCIKWG